MLPVRQQCVQILALVRGFFERMRVEVTVGAFLDAPREVHVKPQRATVHSWIDEHCVRGSC